MLQGFAKILMEFLRFKILNWVNPLPIYGTELTGYELLFSLVVLLTILIVLRSIVDLATPSKKEYIEVD